MENGLPSIGRDQAAHGRPEQLTNVPRARLLGDVHLLPSTCCYIELQSWRVAREFSNAS